MPMPLWWGQINKRLFNKLELRRGTRPVLTHVGRSSGKTYQTPLDAHAVDNGYIFILVYGSESDWVKNIMVSGSAQLRVDGNDVDLISPRLITKEAAFQQMPATTKAPPGFLNVTEFLQMDLRR